ncbi:MAG: DUF4142 domain-containing protein [Bacteroidia bacterium]|nr:DUF4142 domain-containing protein [Bacteroidia bacterium]
MRIANRVFKFLVIIIFLSFFSCIENKEPAYAETKEGMHEVNITTLDSQYICDAFNGGKFEIQLSEHAKNMFSSQKVRDLAEKMVIAHSDLNKEPKALADERELILLSIPTKEENDAILKITSKSGSEFDKMYTDKIIADHEAAVSLFEKAAENANDTGVKKLFAAALPGIKHHLQMAKAVRDSL